MKINLNADLGESFGAWTMGDDEALLQVVGAANIACGFHAGDPLVMRRTVRTAVAETPRLLVAMSQQVIDGHDPARGISRRFDFVQITPDGAAAGAGPAPYLDYLPTSPDLREKVTAAPGVAWQATDPELRLRIVDEAGKVQIEKILRLGELRP